MSTTARTTRKAPVKATVEAAAPARKPRAKKTPGPTPAVARVAHQKVAFPTIARRLSAGFMDFAKKLEAAKDSVLSMGSVAAIIEAMVKNGIQHPRLALHHRRVGSRSHRAWARRRSSGRV